MAREASLWQRLKNAADGLEAIGYRLHIERIENSVGTGFPDTDGAIEGAQFKIEMKSCKRPKRSTTLIRPKSRESQSIWHKKRTDAGSRHHWVLIQVGEAHKAKLYLIPGHSYDKITATEADLAALSLIKPNVTPADVLLRAREGW
jgi:hypothetical protein